MKRLLATTAIVCGALWIHSASAATMPFRFVDGVSGQTDVNVTGSGSFNVNVSTTIGTVSGPFNLFTLNPNGSCAGVGCSLKSNGHGGFIPDPLGTDTELLTFTLNPPGGSNTEFMGFNLAPITLTGTYTAKYSGAELGCAVGDGKSPSSGKTDCFAWTGATSTSFSGFLVVDEAIGNTGKDLRLTFHNASDWSITPTVTAQIIDAPVPEPYSIALLSMGLLGTVALRRRQRR